MSVTDCSMKAGYADIPGTMCRRRERRLFAGVCLLAVVILIIFRSLGAGQRNVDVAQLILQKELVLRPPVTDRNNDVILSSYMNSGSRFTGRLLGFRQDTFYFYEPLWKFMLWEYYRPPSSLCSTTIGNCRKVTTADINKFKLDEITKKIENIMPNMSSSTNIAELFLHVMSSTYTCNLVPLKNVVQDRVQDHPSYGGPSWASYRTCIMEFKPKSVCLRQLEKRCSTATHRVVKVLRTSLSAFRPLLETNPRLKLLHLVRDPRAIINSRIFSRNYPVYGFRSNNSLESNLCDKMSLDYREALDMMKIFPNRVKVIYYEDLMSNLHVRLKHLYSFLNMNYNRTEVESLARVQTNLAPPEKGIDFAKDRQENNAVWWRKYMERNDLDRVDRECSHVYRMYGYKQLALAQLRDLSIPNLNIPEQFIL